MAGHRREFTIVQNETRRTMRQPSNILEYSPQQTAGLADKSAVLRAANRTDESEREALRQLRIQIFESRFADQITDKKARDCSPGACVCLHL